MSRYRGPVTQTQNPDALPAETPSAGDEAEPLPYTTAAAARIELSLQLARLAQQALSMAHPDDRGRPPGPLFAKLGTLTETGRNAIAAAVVADREAGRTWEELGTFTDPPTARQNMQRRYANDIAVWEALRDHTLIDGAVTVATTATRHAATAATAAKVADILFSLGGVGILDDKHGQAPDNEHARRQALNAAVADALPRHTPLSLLRALTQDENNLLAAYAYPDPHALADLAEARARVYDRLAADYPGDHQTDQRLTYEGLAAMERERAAAHRARPAEAVPYSRTAALPASRPAAEE